jgi:hypothetical protein
MLVTLRIITAEAYVRFALWLLRPANLCLAIGDPLEADDVTILEFCKLERLLWLEWLNHGWLDLLRRVSG